MPALMVFLSGLGRWLAGLLPAFFTMFGVGQRVSKILGIAVNVAIVLGVAIVMPLPDWLEELPSQVAELPTLFFWFSALIQLRFGLYVVLSAYVFRWIWRILTK